jgi:hypothetical protein
MTYPIDFPSQFHASVDLARARARRRFLDEASKLPKTYDYDPQLRKALEDLLKKRVRADVKAFGKEACKAVRLGMCHSSFAEPGMKKFLQTSSREAFDDAHQISGSSFHYSYPDLELEITTSREWVKCLGEFAKGPRSEGPISAEEATENSDERIEPLNSAATAKHTSAGAGLKTTEPVDPTLDKPASPRAKGGRHRGDVVDRQKLREYRGSFSQEDFAGKCDVSPDTIQRGEAGGRWDEKTFSKVSDTIRQLTGVTITAKDLMNRNN